RISQHIDSVVTMNIIDLTYNRIANRNLYLKEVSRKLRVPSKRLKHLLASLFDAYIYLKCNGFKLRKFFRPNVSRIGVFNWVILGNVVKLLPNMIKLL